MLSPDFAFTFIDFMPCFWSSVLYFHICIFLSSHLSTASSDKMPSEKRQETRPDAHSTEFASVCPMPNFCPLSTHTNPGSVCNGCLTENECVAPLISQAERESVHPSRTGQPHLGPHRCVLTTDFQNYACSCWTTFSMPSQSASLIIHPAGKRKKQKHRDEEH